MRWFAVAFMVFVTAITAAAQVDDAAGGGSAAIAVPVSPIASIPWGFSNSVIDHKGRLLIFDVTYQYPSLSPAQPIAFRFPPTMNTRVTIIESDASGKRDSSYSGAFQVVGVGRYAVYAVVTDYAVSATSAQAPTVTRRLVALGPSFPVLSSVDVPMQAQVHVSAVGDDGAPDTIAFVDSVPIPIRIAPMDTIAPLPSTPTRQRTVQMLQFDGTSFKALPPVTIAVP
jgi:hypothetical protein